MHRRHSKALSASTPTTRMCARSQRGHEVEDWTMSVGRVSEKNITDSSGQAMVRNPRKYGSSGQRSSLYHERW